MKAATMRRWITRSEAETRAVGGSLAAELQPDGILLLRGDLGSGKTTLTQGLAKSLGFDPREVQSPSYTLIREHRGTRNVLLHVDLYRLDPEDVEAIGLEEVLAGGGVKVIEWAERLPFAVDAQLCLELRRSGEGNRREVLERPCA